MLYTADLPVLEKRDVLVLGAGPSGIAAAVAARREGLNVLLLERYGALGGCLTLGHVATILGEGKLGGLADEIPALLGGSVLGDGIDCEAAKGLLCDFLAREQVDFRLQCPAIDALMEGNTIIGVAALTPMGPGAFLADYVIDATGDGLIAARAGCPVMMGRPGDGLVQPVSLMYTIQGMDPASTLCCRHEEDDTLLPNGKMYLSLCRQAAARGDLPPQVTIVRLYPTATPGERLVNATQENGVQPLTYGEIDRAEIALRRQMEQVNRFLRTQVPGCENIRTRLSASTLGVRESRRIKGRYILRDTDLLHGRTFPDAVVHRANFCIDIHNPEGGGQAETEGCPHTAQPYDIPMGCLQPLGAEHLILAGRIISGDHRAHASYRVMRIGMAIGQAAGAMAASAFQAGKIPVSHLDAADVRARLIRAGCDLLSP